MEITQLCNSSALEILSTTVYADFGQVHFSSHSQVKFGFTQTNCQKAVYCFDFGSIKYSRTKESVQRFQVGF